MVKGVNKTVIEVNNTGSKIFDRVVFYVSPTYSNLNQKNLNRAIKNFTLQIDDNTTKRAMSLRRKYALRRRMIIVSVVGCVAIAGIVLAFVL